MSLRLEAQRLQDLSLEKVVDSNDIELGKRVAERMLELEPGNA